MQDDDLRDVRSEFSGVVSEEHGWRPLQLDPEDYRDEAAKFQLTKDKENELLQELWKLMSKVVDIGWGVDNVQLIMPELFARTEKNEIDLKDSESRDT